MTTDAIGALSNYLVSLPTGPVNDTGYLEGLVANCWDELTGEDERGKGAGGMKAHKVSKRMECVRWEPPKLTFQIERHGGFVLGSSRAEIQRWTLDMAERTRRCEPGGHRQLVPLSARLKVEPLIQRVVGLIASGEQDAWLKWHENGSVTVLVGKIIPVDSAVKQTLVGRRRRFQKALIERLRAKGLYLVTSPYTFHRIGEKAP
jgi:hypothetical protein